MDVQATALDRPSSPPPSLLQDLQCDPAMGVEVCGIAPELDSSSTTSLAADEGSVAGSAGFGVDVQGVEEVPQVRAGAVAVGMASLDGLDLHAIFRRRAIVMRTVPNFLKGAFTAAFRVAFVESIAARAHGDETREVRAWKLFLLISRMLLLRPPRGGLVPRKRLEERFRSFEAGKWESLVLQSMPGADQAAILSASRRRRERTGDVERRAARVQMGELSAGRQALEGAEVAPGTRPTLA